MHATKKEDVRTHPLVYLCLNSLELAGEVEADVLEVYLRHL